MLVVSNETVVATAAFLCDIIHGSADDLLGDYFLLREQNDGPRAGQDFTITY